MFILLINLPPRTEITIRQIESLILLLEWGGGRAGCYRYTTDDGTPTHPFFRALIKRRRSSTINANTSVSILTQPSNVSGNHRPVFVREPPVAVLLVTYVTRIRLTRSVSARRYRGLLIHLRSGIGRCLPVEFPTHVSVHPVMNVSFASRRCLFFFLGRLNRRSRRVGAIPMLAISHSTAVNE